MQVGKTFYPKNRKQWRSWLEKNHSTAKEIWLVYRNQESGAPTISYEDSMEEAICFGWIDGIIKKIDATRYTRRFTPRKVGSAWSEINVARYERMRLAGLLSAAGTKAFGDDSSRRVFISLRKGRTLPPDFAALLEKAPKAKSFYELLSPSYQSHFVNWIEAAKRDETRRQRLHKSIAQLRAGKKLGEP